MRFHYALLLLIGLSFGTAQAKETIPKPDQPYPIDQVRLLGLTLVDNDLNVVRRQLWNIGGFLQARSTVKQRNVDKFFTWSRIRDSYYVEFRYDHSGKITSAKQLFRPASIELVNRYSDIKTREVAQELIDQIGQPTSIQRKGWGGTPNYTAYTWQGDQLTIVVDREGSDRYGNVFIKYTVKRDPYFVAQKKEEE